MRPSLPHHSAPHERDPSLQPALDRLARLAARLLAASGARVALGDGDAAAAPGDGTPLRVPLVDAVGTVLGTIVVAAEAGRAWTDDDRLALADLAAAAAPGIARLTAAPGVDDARGDATRLEDQRAFLAAVLESLSDGVVACDAHGMLTLFNRATREFHGLPEEPLPPEAWAGRYALYREDGVTPLSTDEIPLLRALRGEEVRDVEMVIAPRDGARRVVLANGCAIRDADGRTLGAVIAMHDVTARLRIEETLERERAFLATVLDSLSENVSVCAPNGRLVLFNRATLETHGVSADPTLPPEEWSRYYRIFTADGVTPMPVEALPHVRVLATHEDAADVEFVVHVPGREPRTLIANAHPLRGPDGALLGSVCAARDMSAQKQAERALRESEARYRGVLESLRAPAVQLDTQGRVTFANEALFAMTGWTREETLGADWFARFMPDAPHVRGVFDAMVRLGQLVPHFENEVRCRDGRTRQVAWDNVVLRDGDGTIVGTASVGQDVTDRRALEARLAALSEHDELTGLLNRRGFRRMAAHTLRSASRSRRHDAVLFLDLDRFKLINDTWGHAAGDEALRAVAQVLRDTVRDADFAGRLGGDELAIFAVGLRAGEGAILATRLQANLAAHNARASADGRPYAIECSVGIAELAMSDDLDTLLARADEALYVEKVGRRPSLPAPGPVPSRDPAA